MIRNESTIPEKLQSLVKDDSATGKFDKCIISVVHIKIVFGNKRSLHDFQGCVTES